MELIAGFYIIIGAFQSSDFERKVVSLTGADANAHQQLDNIDTKDTAFFFPQSATGCYDCIVNIGDDYNINDIISGGVSATDRNGLSLRKAYLTGLARTRYDLYYVNSYFGYQ